jgi:hypothetical protein
MKRLFLIVAVIVGAVGCAEAPPPDGARCPCGPGFTCHPDTKTCVRAALMPPSAIRPPPPPPAVRCVDPGPSAPRRLNAEEYRNTIRDLLGLELPYDPPPDDPLPPMPTDSAEPPPVPPPYLALARALAASAAEGSGNLTGCDPTSSDSQGCIDVFLMGLAQRAFRRPPTLPEKDSVRMAYVSGRDSRSALAAAIESLLAAPQFLYRIETGGGPASDKVVPLTAWERATRLSYFLWHTMPDAALFNAAASGALNDPTKVAIHAELMLRDERAGRALAAFHRRWLELDETHVLAELTGTDQPVLRSSVMQSADLFFSALILRDDADLATLLGFSAVYGDGLMSKFYDLEAPTGLGLEMLVPRGAQRRQGLLTTPALLATFSKGADSAPVSRGRVISEKMLCKAFAVPPGTPVPPVQLGSNLTTRQRYAEHSTNPACAVCHEYFDPIGYGLENFDGYGRWRTEENGRPIDASGVIYGTAFDGPAGLAEYLAAPDNAPRCLTIQLFRAALGRTETATDDCTLGALQMAFARSGYRPKSLLHAIVASDAFLYRRSLRR